LFLSVSGLLFFFFQAEDGIRDRNVTGVQTCALPILVGGAAGRARHVQQVVVPEGFEVGDQLGHAAGVVDADGRDPRIGQLPVERSEERRVGKGGRGGGWEGGEERWAGGSGVGSGRGG